MVPPEKGRVDREELQAQGLLNLKFSVRVHLDVLEQDQEGRSSGPAVLIEPVAESHEIPEQT